VKKAKVRLPSGTFSHLPALYSRCEMYGIKELAEILELSEKQVRRRLALVLPYLDGHLRKGPRGKILVDEQGLDLLQEMVARERAGASLTQAVRSLAQVLQSNIANGNNAKGNLPQHARQGAEIACNGEAGLTSNESAKVESIRDNVLSSIPETSGKVEVPAWVISSLIAMGICQMTLLLLILVLLVT